MSEIPNLPGLIEDPAHPDFQSMIVDLDGVRWCAMWEADPAAPLDTRPVEMQSAEVAALGPPIWERLA